MTHRNLAAVLILVTLMITGSSGPAWAGAGSTPPGSPLSVEMLTALDSAAAQDQITVIIRLKEQALENTLQLQAIENLSRADRVEAVVTSLQAQAEGSQGNLRRFLEDQQRQGTVSEITPFWIFNGLAVNASPEVIRQLAEFPEVEEIRPELVIHAPEMPDVSSSDIAANAALQNLELINAPDLWAMGLKGQGVVVAILDSGVDYTHPALIQSYRGGSNSWYDPYGENLMPVDLAGGSTGHGTHVMGIMVGEVVEGQGPGVAPDAKWIAAKIFNNAGAGSETVAHQAFEWVLSQANASPNTPFVLNNSWGARDPGCSHSQVMETDLRALRAAGILPIFSAGNSGPAHPSDLSPGNFADAFSVGSINNLSKISDFSSRGPSDCTKGIFPKVVAPGESIYSTFPKGTYRFFNGTSMAAPHASGGLALLLSAYPNITVAEQEAALLSVVDIGPAGPDYDYGYGRIDLLRAYNWVKTKHLGLKFYLPQLFLQPEE